MFSAIATSVDGVPVATPEASKKRQMADAAPTPSVKRIKLSVSPKAEPNHPEHAPYMTQKAARKEATAQEHEPDFETTSQAYNDADEKAWWMRFASEVLEEAQNMNGSMPEEDEPSVYESDKKSRERYATPTPQAQNPSQQLDSHLKVHPDPDPDINPESARYAAENGSVDRQKADSQCAGEDRRLVAMLKVQDARRRGLEVLLRCTAQEDQW